MASDVLNAGPLGDVPEDIVGGLHAAAQRIVSDVVDESGSIDYGRLPDSDELRQLERAVRALRVFGLDTLGDWESRTAFWVNLHNCLAIHSIIERQIVRSVREVRGFFHSAYDIGGLLFSMDQIQHGVLRANRWKHPLLPRPFSVRDPRRAFAMGECDPRIHFALVFGARSCPSLAMYEPERIEEQLEDAARAFVRSRVVIDHDRAEVTLPAVFRWFHRDFGESEADVLRFVLLCLAPDEGQGYLRQNLLEVRVIYAPFDWSLNHA